MPTDVAASFEKLFDKNPNAAYEALQTLQRESEVSNKVYPFMERLSVMLDCENSYVRNRAMVLIAHNAKWDSDNKVDEVLDRYLLHINDAKPISARQCVKLLPIIAKYKPELKAEIVSALQNAELSSFPDSMRPLLLKDIQNSLNEIEKL